MPDSEMLRKIILRECAPKRVHFCELVIDIEVMKAIFENYMGGTWVDTDYSQKDSIRALYKNAIECWYRLGYDYIRIGGGPYFPAKWRKGEDTAALSRGERLWTEEGVSLISSWEDFEKYPWPKDSGDNLWTQEFTSNNLPEGMGFFTSAGNGVLEVTMSSIFGYENMSLLIYDDPKLVKAVVDRVGEQMYKWYEKVVGIPELMGFYQGDDMGYKTSTMFSPEFLREYILPWHKKFAKLAHDNGLLYILHSCGQLDEIMDDLIHYVKIDGKHSYEDEITPVWDFKKKYGQDIAVLGGVDVDKLCRCSEREIRRYVRAILDSCMEGGGYLLGSGNTVANYIPVENFLIMLDEALNWKG